MFQYKKQLDELALFKNNNKMTRSIEKEYLEKCRDFVEMMTASESLVSMSTNNEQMNRNNEEICNVDKSNNIELSEDMINICNEYQQFVQEECKQIMDKYSSDIHEYCKWYEMELNKYYTDYTNTILWDYYNNTTKFLENMNESLITENKNLSENLKSKELVETNYNNLKKDYNHLFIENKEINRRLYIMINEYHKLYNQYNKTKPPPIEDIDEFIYIRDDYNYN